MYASRDLIEFRNLFRRRGQRFFSSFFSLSLFCRTTNEINFEVDADVTRRYYNTSVALPARSSYRVRTRKANRLRIIITITIKILLYHHYYYYFYDYYSVECVRRLLFEKKMKCLPVDWAGKTNTQKDIFVLIGQTSKFNALQFIVYLYKSL